MLPLRPLAIGDALDLAVRLFRAHAGIMTGIGATVAVPLFALPLCAFGAMAAPFARAGITHVLGIEARGFILGGAVATSLGAGFVPARKPGKLPWESLRESYDLEYGQDALEAHSDSWTQGARVLVVDDVLATGGTARAAGQLARGLGADLAGWTFLLEIETLAGRRKLDGAELHAVTRV